MGHDHCGPNRLSSDSHGLLTVLHTLATPFLTNHKGTAGPVVCQQTPPGRRFGKCLPGFRLCRAGHVDCMAEKGGIIPSSNLFEGPLVKQGIPDECVNLVVVHMGGSVGGWHFRC